MERDNLQKKIENLREEYITNKQLIPITAFCTIAGIVMAATSFDNAKLAPFDNFFGYFFTASSSLFGLASYIFYRFSRKNKKEILGLEKELEKYQ